MNKQKTSTIIKFTLREYFESKFFIIFNIVSLITMLVGLNFNTLKTVLNIPEKEIKYKIEVVDNSNLIYDKFTSIFEYSGDYEITRSPQNNYTKENIKEENIIIEIEHKDAGHFKSTITTKQNLKDDIKLSLKKTFTAIQNEMFEKDYNISNEDIDLIIKGPEIETVFLSVVSEGYIEKIFIKYMAGAITLFVAMLIFSKIASDIAQEKQSKSSEYILTTVSSKDYLFAKVFGNILFIIIQFLLMIVYLFVGIGLASLLNIHSMDISNINLDTTSQILSIENIELIGTILILNVLTLIFLSFIQGAMAAKSTSIQDASNSSLVLIAIYTVLFISTMSIIDQYTMPNLFLKIVSVIPIISSFFIPALMIIGQCSVWQIVVSLALLIISIPISFNYSQRKFKEGILNYSKKKKTKEEDNTSIIINKNTFSRIGNVIGIGIIIFLGLNVILSTITQTVLSSMFTNILSKTDILLITQIIVSALSLFLTYKYVIAHAEKESPSKVKRPYKTKFVLIAFGLIALLQIVLEYIFTLLHIDYDVTAIFDISATSPMFTKILFILAIAIIPAIFEELFCRKAIINLLRPHGRLFAIVTSSIIFGLIHMNIQQFIFAFLVGILLAVIYQYTKNIKLTIFIHFVNNFVSTLPLLFGEHMQSVVLILYSALIIIAIVTILVLFINRKSKTDIGKMIKSLKEEYFNRFKPSYIFLFSDFMLDISIVALLLLSIYQQNILELLQ